MDVPIAALQDKAVLAQRYEWPRVLAVTGALGSGKTEWVMDLASALALPGRAVLLADMDIINPYFCLRSVAGILENDNLTVLTPPGELRWGDLTYLNFAIRARLADDSATTILDVGGDSQGGLALKQFECEIKEAGYSLHFVVNPYRTHTRSFTEVRDMKERLESTCGLKVSGIVANAHLGPDTTPGEAADGSLVVREFADRLGLPLLYALVDSRAALRASSLLPGDVQIWPLRRRILAPWEKIKE